jgi:hypothetical protein
MAQTYDPTLPQEGVTTFGELYGVLKTKFETIRSNFSGTAFPDNPVIGQTCYRTDLNKYYVYSGDVSLGTNGWIEITSELSAVIQEVINSRGTKSSLDQRLDVVLNEDGTLKTDVVAYQSEWIKPSLTFTYVAANQFSVEGDQTDIYYAGRRLKINLSTSFVVTEVYTSTYDSTNNITTVITVDSVIDDTLVSVEHALIHSNTSYSSLPYSYTSSPRVLVRANADGKIDSSFIGDVDNALKWDGATKYVSTTDPSGGSDGDIWFQY